MRWPWTRTAPEPVAQPPEPGTGTDPVPLAPPNVNAVRSRHRNNLHRDLTIAKALAKGLGMSETGRRLGHSVAVVGKVRDRMETPLSCMPCEPCQRLLTIQADLTHTHHPPTARTATGVRHRATKRGVHLIARGGRYAVIGPDDMMTLSEAACIVDTYPLKKP